MLSTRKPDGRLFALAALSILAFLAPGGVGRPQSSAQVKAKAPAASLQHEVSVTLKLIQVFVTAADGKPALDLERPDFILTDNGKPQTITDFERHVLAPPAPERAVPAAQVAAPAPSPKPEVPLLSRKFIFLIDYTRNGLQGVQKAKQAALEFLASKVGPDDEVALFTLSPMSGLTLYENLTKDQAKVRNKVSRLREFVGGGSDGPAGDFTGMELMNASLFAIHGGHAGPTQRNLFTDVAEWAKALRAIPGQKNIIWFTMGYGTGAVRRGSLNNVLFEAMARALASANAPVFTVDTSPQAMPGREVWDKLPSGTLPERSLAYLSEMTGGKFLGGVNYSARIAEDIHDATANYYVLGYSIPVAWDGKYHDVKVDVVKPGYKVHAQRGYFNPVPFAKLTPVEKHLHLIGLVLGDAASGTRDLDFPMTALPFAPAGQAGNILLLSELSIPSLRNVVGDRTEFITLVLAEGGAIIDGKRAEIDWQDFKAEKIFQYGVAALAPGRYDCRAVVRNLDDGRAAVGSCVVEVAAPLTEGPLMFPPLLLVRGAEARYLNLASAGEPGGPEGFSISRVFPFPAKEYVPLIGALEQGATSLLAGLRCIWGKERDTNGEFDLSAWLAFEGSGEGEPIEMSLLERASLDEADFYFLEFELPELQPGRYRLELRAENPETGAVVSTASGFTVR